MRVLESYEPEKALADFEDQLDEDPKTLVMEGLDDALPDEYKEVLGQLNRPADWGKRTKKFKNSKAKP